MVNQSAKIQDWGQKKRSNLKLMAFFLKNLWF